MLIYLTYLIRFILAVVFAAFVLSSALLPATRFLESKRVPRPLAALLPLLLVIVAVITVFIPLGPPVSAQIQSFASSLPGLLDRLGRSVGSQIRFSSLFSYLTQNIQTIGKNLFIIGQVLVEIIGGVLLGLFITFYILWDNRLIKQTTIALFPAKQQLRVRTIYENSEIKLGFWLRGQVFLSIVVGLLFGLAYFSIGLPNALLLAILAGAFEIIPNIGPVAGAIPGFIVASTISLNSVLFVALAYAVIHFLEGYVLTPFIMQRAVGLHPIAIVLAIIIGTIYMGIVGALLAVPFLSFLVLIIREAKE